MQQRRFLEKTQMADDGFHEMPLGSPRRSLLRHVRFQVRVEHRVGIERRTVQR
ncbi:MAG: hypothetical protein VB140_08370 [Burkholderia sp.]